MSTALFRKLLKNTLRHATLALALTAGLAALTAAGHTYEMGGMIWIQGEADTGSLANANQYEADLSGLIARVRRDVFGGQSPGGYTLPFIISGLSTNQYSNIATSGTGPNIVRQAQEVVAANGRQTAFVNTDGFETYAGGEVHFVADSQIAIGKACVEQMLLLEAQDADRDGLLLDEEAAHGTNPGAADSDGDGQADGVEVAAGTSPTNAASLFAITSFMATSNALVLQWPSRPGNLYSVEESTDLRADWTVAAADYPAADPGSNTTWFAETGEGNARTGTVTLAHYDAETGLNGNFNTTSFDSVDTEPTTTATRMTQSGGLTGGGASAYVLANAFFDPSDSGSPGFNFADASQVDRAAALAVGDVFSFVVQANGGAVTYESLSWYGNQYRETARVDISHTIAGGTEVFVLQGFAPSGATAGSGPDVTYEEVDFADFTSDQNVTWTFYLYGASTATYGIRFDDITLQGSVDTEGDEAETSVEYWRINLTGTGP